MANMRAIRRELGLSQAELADLLGVRQSTISRFETGHLPIDERTQLALEGLKARHASPAEAA